MSPLAPIGSGNPFLSRFFLRDKKDCNGKRDSDSETPKFSASKNNNHVQEQN
jgi:hypothetical protein